MIAGNKVDIPSEEQEVFIEDVKDWLEEEYGENKYKEAPVIVTKHVLQDSCNRVLSLFILQYPEPVQNIPDSAEYSVSRQ